MPSPVVIPCPAPDTWWRPSWWRPWPAAILPLALLLLTSAGCDRSPATPVLAFGGHSMGTSYSVQIVTPPPALDAAKLQRQVNDLLEQINASMSTWRPDSELSRFNANPSTDWVAVSPDLAAVVASAQSVSVASDGAFDITVGPLVALWGFGPSADPGQTPETVPAPAAIAAARARTGFRQLAVRTDPPALRKARPDLYLDLSGIAKGHGVDRVAALLASLGLGDFLVEIGGELVGRGVNARGEPWRIAIERPDPGPTRRPLQVLPLNGRGLATSGDYRNFFEHDGVRYTHSIDPASGRPVAHQLASVTVVANSAELADAWATALLVLGPERGPEMARAQDLAALFLIRTEGADYRVESTIDLAP
ncbi:MAG: FAD:protein FMN transferase [Chromatiaceae bacterium]|nr:MAG: FAD:protein FMN transferase [Chromatiaceae bacterium]